MTWQEELIKEAEKVIKHGWGKVLLTVTQRGKRISIDTTFTAVNRKEVKIEGADST